MKKHPNGLWGISLFLGWIFDLFFIRGKAVGPGVFALYLALVLAGGLAVLLINDLKPARKTLWLLIPFFLFGAVTYLRQEPVTLTVAFLFIALSLFLFASSYLGGQWMKYTLARYFMQALEWFGTALTEPISFLVHQIRDRKHLPSEKKGFPLGAVLRGLLIALPILLCFTGLLSSADLIFNQYVENALESFGNWFSLTFFLRGSQILMIAYIVAGTFLFTSKYSRDEKLAEETAEKKPGFLGFTEASVVLGSVVLLFSLFVFIQFRYFFGGNANIGIAGYTYSEYARRGFNEMVLVGLFSLLLIIIASNITRRSSVLQQRVFTGLNIAMVSLVLVILVSAYQRISLAIDWHGYSRLRLYPRMFLIWVAILFVAVVILELLHHERHFLLAILAASFGFGMTLALINVDGEIVRMNVSRAAQGKNFNIGYLSTLSPDAIPALNRAARDPTLDSRTRQRVGAVLFCYVHSDWFENPPEESWRTWSISNARARYILNRSEDLFAGYNVSHEGGSDWVRTPDGDLFECASRTDADEYSNR